MIQYVAGLLYGEDGLRVALILKNRPTWQAGLFNALGGKVEAGETAEQAMRREFIEEAGVDVDWSYRLTLEGPDYQVHFFSRHDDQALDALETRTDEVVHVVETYSPPENLLPNLWWLLPLMNDDSVEPQTIRVS